MDSTHTREKPTASCRVLLADDHTIFREGLKSLLQREGFTIVAEAANGRDAVTLTRKLQPDVGVLDIAMPQLNGIDAAREIHRRRPGSKTILLTVHDEHHYVLEALRAGVNGYVLKTQAIDHLAHAIRSVLDGNIYLSPGISNSVVSAALARKSTEDVVLSLREREVLQLIAEGKTNKEIDALLALSPKTVDGHRQNLMEKLKIHETASLVRYAVKIGLIQP